MQKTWVRIIVSLFLGGAVSEGIHILTGDPNRPQETNLSILYAIIIYIVISITVKLSNRISKVDNQVKTK